MSLPLSAVIVRSLRTFVFAKANCYCCYFYAHKIRQNKTWWWRDENGVRNIAETALTLLCWFMDCRCFSFVTALHGCTHAYTSKPATTNGMDGGSLLYLCSQTITLVFVCLVPLLLFASPSGFFAILTLLKSVLWLKSKWIAKRGEREKICTERNCRQEREWIVNTMHSEWQ